MIASANALPTTNQRADVLQPAMQRRHRVLAICNARGARFDSARAPSRARPYPIVRAVALLACRAACQNISHLFPDVAELAR